MGGLETQLWAPQTAINVTGIWDLLEIATVSVPRTTILAKECGRVGVLMAAHRLC